MVTGAVENGMASPQKIKCRIMLSSRNSTSRYIPKRNKSRDLNRYMYTHVHSSIIRNSQKVEAAQVSFDGWKDKQNVIYTYNIIQP